VSSLVDVESPTISVIYLIAKLTYQL